MSRHENVLTHFSVLHRGCGRVSHLSLHILHGHYVFQDLWISEYDGLVS